VRPASANPLDIVEDFVLSFGNKTSGEAMGNEMARLYNAPSCPFKTLTSAFAFEVIVVVKL
jgi:hypothetical protein